MKEEKIAQMLGIKISHKKQSGKGEYWTIETPASVKAALFSKKEITTYKCTTKNEVDAFITGYSLVARYVLQDYHTPE